MSNFHVEIRLRGASKKAVKRYLSLYKQYAAFSIITISILVIVAGLRASLHGG